MIVIIISFILENILSIIFNNNSFLLPFATLSSLLIIYPYFKSNNQKYYITCFLTGFLYDITYTNTILLNAFLFLLIGVIITLINNIVSNNYFNDMLVMIVIVIIYQSILFLILSLLNYTNFNLITYVKSITLPLTSTVVYTFILYITVDKISKKLKIQREK